MKTHEPDENEGEEWKAGSRRQRFIDNCRTQRIEQEIRRSQEEADEIRSYSRQPVGAVAVSFDPGDQLSRFHQICSNCKEPFYTALLKLSLTQCQVVMPCPNCGFFADKDGVRDHK